MQIISCSDFSELISLSSGLIRSLFALCLDFIASHGVILGALNLVPILFLFTVNCEDQHVAVMSDVLGGNVLTVMMPPACSCVISVGVKM